jgi:septin 3/9/12
MTARVVFILSNIFANDNISSTSTKCFNQVTLGSYVGFDNIPKQIEKKLVRRGFSFNVMVVGNFDLYKGRSGLGKSTMINTLFAAHLLNSKGVSPKQTTEVTTVTNRMLSLT